MISVVIPAYNAEKSIGNCLQGLKDQSAPRGSFEIIVVDDGSADRTSDIATASNACVLRQPNSGAAAARNLGAQHACGDLVFFLDADSTPDPYWISAMSAPFADPGVAGVSGVKKTRQSNLWALFVQAEYDFKYERISTHNATDFVDTSTAGYRRQIFLSNGGFDAALMDAEDVELSFRLADRGYRMVLSRNAITYHTHPTSPLEYYLRKFRYAQWRARVYARYPHKVASDSRTPQTQKLQAALAVLLIPLVTAVLLRPDLVWAPLACSALFLLTTLPFVRFTSKRNWRVGLTAPLALLVAAYVGASGLALGIFQGAPSAARPGRIP